MKSIVDDIMDKIPDQFNMVDIMAKVEERTPYVIVAFQVTFNNIRLVNIQISLLLLERKKTF